MASIRATAAANLLVHIGSESGDCFLAVLDIGCHFGGGTIGSDTGDFVDVGWETWGCSWVVAGTAVAGLLACGLHTWCTLLIINTYDDVSFHFLGLIDRLTVAKHVGVVSKALNLATIAATVTRHDMIPKLNIIGQVTSVADWNCQSSCRN